MKKCKLILFDLDGVTIDTEPLYAKAEIKLFKEYGVNIPNEDWKLFRGCSEQAFYTISMERYNIKEGRDTFINKGRQYVIHEFENGLKFMDGFLQLIDKIKNDYELGLVTASPRSTFDWVNQRLSLHSIFKKIHYNEMSKNSKPNPEPYLNIINEFNITPEETLIIEDSVHGINAGLSSGAKVIALEGSVEVDDMPAAHHIVNSLNEITDELINSLFN